MYQRLFFLLILHSISLSVLSAQTISDIDSLLTQTYYLNQVENNKGGAIDIAFKAIRSSKEISYERGEVMGLYTVAVVLADIHQYEKSIEYLDLAQKHTIYLRNNPDIAFNLLMLEATNNYEMGFSGLATAGYQQAKDVILKESDNGKKMYYLMIHHMKASLGCNDTDILYGNYKKALEINQQWKVLFPDKKMLKEDVYAKRAEICENIGSIHLERGDLDSARFYYLKVLEAGNEIQSIFIKAFAYGDLGKLAEREGELNKALTYLDGSEKLLLSSGLHSNLMLIYSIKRSIYEKLGDTQKEGDNMRSYQTLSDGLDRVKNKGRDKTILKLVDEKEAELQQLQLSKNRNVFIFCTFSSLTLAIGYTIFIKYKKRKELQLTHQQEYLDRIELEIKEREQEAEKMRQKLNENFKDLITMAKNNDPQFWSNFVEVHPNFTQSLLANSTGLKVSELTFCAYLYLGFSTKEIAEYTYKAQRTVENNRYNLRKKFNIPSNDDLSIWIRETVSI